MLDLEMGWRCRNSLAHIKSTCAKMPKFHRTIILKNLFDCCDSPRLPEKKCTHVYKLVSASIYTVTRLEL